MATYYVNSQTSLTAALQSVDTNIDIIVTGSFEYTNSNPVSVGKNVTITSDVGGPYEIKRNASVMADAFNIPINASLTMSDIIIDGNKAAGQNGSSLIRTNGTLTVNDGTILRNNSVDYYYYTEGGAVRIDYDGILIMNGGEISGNSVGQFSYGGGIFSFGRLVINDGLITNNTAETGGGIWLDAANYPDYFTMTGGSITNNHATVDGGGIRLSVFDPVTISNAVITGNTAGQNGGGIWDYGGPSLLTITGNTVISDNTAANDGGGIYKNPSAGGSTVINGNTIISDNVAGIDGGGIFYSDLSNLTVDSGVTFSKNRAIQAYNRNPIDDALYNANIHATQWTVPLPQGYNNYDISYTAGTPFVFPVNVALSARKTATGATLPAAAFTFTVKDNLGNVAGIATNDANGDIVFLPIVHSAPGTYTYTITEDPTSLTDWTADTRSFQAVVTVTDNGSGIYQYTLAYPNGYPEFANTYATSPLPPPPPPPPIPPVPPAPPIPPTPPYNPYCCPTWCCRPVICVFWRCG